MVAKLLLSVVVDPGGKSRRVTEKNPPSGTQVAQVISVVYAVPAQAQYPRKTNVDVVQYRRIQLMMKT